VPFNADPRQQAIRDEVKIFAEKEILPVSQQLDRQDDPPQFPRGLYRKLGQAGFNGIAYPKEYGGRGGSFIEYCTAIEELCYWDPGIGLLCAVGELATQPIFNFASEEHKKTYVPPSLSGERVLAFALTEPDAGSDASNQKTTAVEQGDEYIVNGEKIFIMHGDAADLAVLFCKIEGHPKISVLLVDTDQPGWQKRGLKYKMGMRAATTGHIVIKDVRVPKKNLMGEMGRGFRYALQTLDAARIGVAAQGVGIAQRALDEAVAYANKRQTFGQLIGKFQAIQWMIADMSTQLEAARCLTYKAAQLKDAGLKYGLEASQAKLYASETSRFCIDRAMQIHGGYGYIGEFSPIEKLYRDQRVLEIYEGTSEIQRLVIASHVLGGR
jgi:butyryl-CoA dehydrogenase